MIFNDNTTRASSHSDDSQPLRSELPIQSTGLRQGPHAANTFQRPMLRATKLALILGVCAALTLWFVLHQWNTQVQVQVPTSPEVTQAECSKWKLLSIPELDGKPLYGAATGVAAITKDDVWIVGYTFDEPQEYKDFIRQPHRPLLMHWNGKTLSVDSSLKAIFSSGYAELKDVTAISANDVWAVGYSTDNMGRSKPLILHWDGNAWSVVNSPQLPEPKNAPLHRQSGLLGQYNVLNAVAGVSKDNVWAVGTYKDSDGINRILIEHWDGNQWQQLDEPTLNGLPDQSNGTERSDMALHDVAAIAANDIWAVGSNNLIMHWNGSQWDLAEMTADISNLIADRHPRLLGVSASSSNDVWTVGNIGSTVIEHWDGSRWKIASSPNPAPLEGNSLVAVEAVASNNVWAVGDKFEALRGENHRRSMVMHWNGSAWSEVDAPQASRDQALFGLASVPFGGVWTVGVSSPTDMFEGPTAPLVAHVSGCSEPIDNARHIP